MPGPVSAGAAGFSCSFLTQSCSKSVALFNNSSLRSKLLIAATFAFMVIVNAVSLHNAVRKGLSSNLSAKILAAWQPASWFLWAHSTTASKVGLRSVLVKGSSSASSCFALLACWAEAGAT